MTNKYILILIIIFQIIGCKTIEKKNKISRHDVIPLELINEYKLDFDEPSGLCFNPINNTLLIVSDGNSTVYETDLFGKVIKKTILDDVDLEGITLSQNCDTMYVVNEAYQLVSKYLTDGTKLKTFPVHVATNKDHSLEGITLDDKQNLVVLNEKLRCLLMKFSNEQEILRKELEFVEDCADITYDKEHDCFWLISDESKTVCRISKNGDLLEEYSVPFRKGEGIAVINNKVYIVNDDNSVLYVFNKPKLN